MLGHRAITTPYAECCGELVVKRPPIYFDQRRPDEIALRITPPPLLLHAFDGDLDRLVHHMKRLSDHAGQQQRPSSAFSSAFQHIFPAIVSVPAHFSAPLDATAAAAFR